MKIQKRDGSLQEFSEAKLHKVILKAFSDFPDIDSTSVDQCSTDIISSVLALCKKLEDKGEQIGVEDIQDQVVHRLRQLGYRKVANEYEKVRAQRALDRTLRGVMDTLSNDATEEKTDNGNVNGYTCSGRHLHISEDIIKLHAKTKVFSKDIIEAINNGLIYVHDNGWTGTGSCVSSDSILYVKDSEGVKMYTAEELYTLLGSGYCCDILSNGSWTKLIAANRKLPTSDVYILSDKYTSVTLTGDHVVPSYSHHGGRKDRSVEVLSLDHYLVNDSLSAITNDIDEINIIPWCQDCELVLNSSFNSNYNTRFIKKYLGSLKKKTIPVSDLSVLSFISLSDVTVQTKNSHTRGLNPILTLDKDLGYLVGLVLSDGSVSSDGKSVTFTNKDSRILKRYYDIVSTKFPDLNIVVSEKVNSPGVFDLTIHSDLYNRLFSKILAEKQDATLIRLNPSTISFNNSYLIGLLSGYLDGDGCVYQGKISPGVDDISLISSCKSLLNQFRELLHLLGIQSYIKQCWKTNSSAKFYGKLYNRTTSGYVLKIRHSSISNFMFMSNSVKLEGKVPSIRTRRFNPERIIEKKAISYEGYVYDFQTANHYFTTNGLVVHNCTCVQINLEELFKGGFSTGHGYLREPSNIKTAFLLSAIAIQSNQNDQHGGQSLCYFDRALAPYVLKSYKKHLKTLLEYESKKQHIPIDPERITEALSNINSITDMLKDNVFLSRMAYDYTYEDCLQGAESIVHNLNSMASRAGKMCA